MYQKNAEATALKNRMYWGFVIFCIVIVRSLVICNNIIERREYQTRLEALPLDELQNRFEIVTGIIDPCHNDLNPTCPKRQFVAIVPKLKGIRAILAVSEPTISADLPYKVDRVVCETTEVVGASTFAPYELKINPKDPGRFEAILMVCKDNQVIEVPFKNSITISYQAITPPSILYHLPW